MTTPARPSRRARTLVLLLLLALLPVGCGEAPLIDELGPVGTHEVDPAISRLTPADTFFFLYVREPRRLRGLLASAGENVLEDVLFSTAISGAMSRLPVPADLDRPWALALHGRTKRRSAVPNWGLTLILPLRPGVDPDAAIEDLPEVLEHDFDEGYFSLSVPRAGRFGRESPRLARSVPEGLLAVRADLDRLRTVLARLEEFGTAGPLPGTEQVIGIAKWIAELPADGELRLGLDEKDGWVEVQAEALSAHTVERPVWRQLPEAFPRTMLGMWTADGDVWEQALRYLGSQGAGWLVRELGRPELQDVLYGRKLDLAESALYVGSHPPSNLGVTGAPVPQPPALLWLGREHASSDGVLAEGEVPAHYKSEQLHVVPLAPRTREDWPLQPFALMFRSPPTPWLAGGLRLTRVDTPTGIGLGSTSALQDVLDPLDLLAARAAGGAFTPGENAAMPLWAVEIDFAGLQRLLEELSAGDDTPSFEHGPMSWLRASQSGQRPDPGGALRPRRPADVAAFPVAACGAAPAAR